MLFVIQGLYCCFNYFSVIFLKGIDLSISVFSVFSYKLNETFGSSLSSLSTEDQSISRRSSKNFFCRNLLYRVCTRKYFKVHRLHSLELIGIVLSDQK